MALDWLSAPPNAAIARPRPSARPRFVEDAVLPGPGTMAFSVSFLSIPCSSARAGVARSAAMASTAKPFLSIRNPPFPLVKFQSMMRAVRMLFVVVLVAVSVTLVLAAFVDDLRGDVDGRERREDERLEEAGEQRQEQHRDLHRDPAA